MSETFFWYDYETFGIDPKGDRPAQFAGIRTNLDLEEIDAPVKVYCKPSLDALPSATSCFITSITPQFCQKEGLLEHAFASSVHRELSRPNTIGVGFNSIKFDDEFNRFLFWRNLFDPYAYAWDKGCSRWDLLKIIPALYALKPNALTWPADENKIISIKLEQLSRANNLTHESAHDALSDARATLELARLIKKREPRFFDYCLKLRNKAFVLSQFSSKDKKMPVLPPIDKRTAILHASQMLGAARGFLTMVYPLAVHPTNNNEIIVWDLRADPRMLADLDADEIKTRLFTKNEHLTDQNLRLPLKTIAINKSPFVIADTRVLSNERASQLDMDLDQIQKHAEYAKKIQREAAVWQKVYTRSFEPMEDVDKSLYQGFVPREDRVQLERIRESHASDLSENSGAFMDSRLDELVFRYRARNFPEYLSAEETEKWKAICFQKIDSKLPALKQELEDLRSKANPSEAIILDQVQLWAQYLCDNVGIK